MFGNVVSRVSFTFADLINIFVTYKWWKFGKQSYWTQPTDAARSVWNNDHQPHPESSVVCTSGFRDGGASWPRLRLTCNAGATSFELIVDRNKHYELETNQHNHIGRHHTLFEHSVFF